MFFFFYPVLKHDMTYCFSVSDELNQAVCWYLTCDRYWEEPLSDLKGFPWGLVFVFVMVLSLGLCLCYYIIWVLFDSDDLSIGSNSVTDSPSPHHSQYNPDLGPDEQYIYVTYPPELKRRLLESSNLLAESIEVDASDSLISIVRSFRQDTNNNLTSESDERIDESCVEVK
ncbi:uncharacterized protein LOC113466954 [Diaphorina citri]|uniref:Uncharacterized protein LOC113466954 n=1 Tax=Diaphorina citri TaxID=121845 RepID=A0A3Q0IW52_DIACI|nr:uncharacterized protein LOC113466954 [Diaphorina citri]